MAETHAQNRSFYSKLPDSKPPLYRVQAREAYKTKLHFIRLSIFPNILSLQVLIKSRGKLNEYSEDNTKHFESQNGKSISQPTEKI
jgi:hypothetical protein